MPLIYTFQIPLITIFLYHRGSNAVAFLERRCPHSNNFLFIISMLFPVPPYYFWDLVTRTGPYAPNVVLLFVQWHNTDHFNNFLISQVVHGHPKTSFLIQHKQLHTQKTEARRKLVHSACAFGLFPTSVSLSSKGIRDLYSTCCYNLTCQKLHSFQDASKRHTVSKQINLKK